MQWKKEVADIEVYQDLFLYVGHDLDGEGQYEFALHQSSGTNIGEFVKRMFTENIAMLGYNCKGYDAHVLEFIYKNAVRFADMNNVAICMEIFRFSKGLIQAEKKPWLSNPKLPYFDIYKLHHFDNKAKACSLKWIEFAMRDKNIEDLPYPPEEPLEDLHKITRVIEYCHHDVRATKAFIEASKGEIELRRGLSETYGLNLYDANDSKMGAEIILKFIAEEMGRSKKDIREMRTWRSAGIDLKDIILPYVSFKTKEFNDVLDKFRNTVVVNTKGDLKHQQMFRGIPYDYGTGGIHACGKSGSFNSDEEFMLLDIDVTSYYPNLAIRNKQAPAHLGDAFCVTYENIFNTRRTFPKGTPENYGLKIALNGVFG